MKITMEKHLINITITIVISIVLASSINKMPNEAFLNTIYTISGIMFSIGMGLLCTLIPDKVKNETIYKKIKKNVLEVRNAYISYFSIISFSYLIYQLFPEAAFSVNIKNLNVVFSLYYTAALLNILSILYFIANFIEIQKLGFDISDRTRS